MEERIALFRECETGVFTVSDLCRRDELETLDRPFGALTRAVWDTPVRTLVDLQERALIVKHCHREQPSVDHVGGKPRVWTDPEKIDDWDERGIAHLVQAVLQFAGGPAFALDDPHRASWNEGLAKANAAWAKLHVLREAGADDATLDAAGDEAAAIDNELGDVARRIWREGSADIMLLGEICYSVMWWRT